MIEDIAKQNDLCFYRLISKLVSIKYEYHKIQVSRRSGSFLHLKTDQEILEFISNRFCYANAHKIWSVECHSSETDVILRICKERIQNINGIKCNKHDTQGN